MATQWIQDQAYSAYQADTTSSESVSDEASESCRFIHSQCDKELFTGDAVAVQFMRWPDDNELEAVENDEEDEELDEEEAEDSPEEPEEEPLGRRGRQLKRLRTRITIYFSVFSSTTLQLRTIVEASLAPAAALPALTTTQPTDADMLKYFKSPSSWEMRSQISQKYTKNL
ncbi:ATP-dependent RNA helicase [Phytophthora nicotianae]|uniref:ATP-dependent RNA helicase n=1 Tax=Phytophthora nicotianae TaxID=4792 RepID=A0A0W8DBU6_PHYNI|nr:ATP-dependent RNA helicase [Phytophthora nicotianae]